VSMDCFLRSLSQAHRLLSDKQSWKNRGDYFL
jgi:hypothetical protein